MSADAVLELVEQITSHIPAGSLLTLRRIVNAPRVQRRVEGAARSEDLIQRARAVRLEDDTPFWHALFDLGEDQPSGVPIEIVKSALYHQDPRDDYSESVRVDVGMVERVAAMASSVPENEALTLDSRVLLPDGTPLYIPMIDFSVKSNRPGGTATAHACVQAIAEPGLLVASGRSFHFYGRRLLDTNEQVLFWARALLLTPMVDERWIAHQMLGGRAALRISQNSKGNVPRVIWEAPETTA